MSDLIAMETLHLCTIGETNHFEVVEERLKSLWRFLIILAENISFSCLFITVDWVEDISADSMKGVTVWKIII